jgi:hypothetical protein
MVELVRKRALGGLKSAEDRARQLSQTQKGRSDAKEARHAAAEAVGARAQRQTKLARARWRTLRLSPQGIRPPGRALRFGFKVFFARFAGSEEVLYGLERDEVSVDIDVILDLT